MYHRKLVGTGTKNRTRNRAKPAVFLLAVPLRLGDPPASGGLPPTSTRVRGMRSIGGIEMWQYTANSEGRITETADGAKTPSFVCAGNLSSGCKVLGVWQAIVNDCSRRRNHCEEATFRIGFGLILALGAHCAHKSGACSSGFLNRCVQRSKRVSQAKSGACGAKPENRCRLIADSSGPGRVIHAR